MLLLLVRLLTEEQLHHERDDVSYGSDPGAKPNNAAPAKMVESDELRLVPPSSSSTTQPTSATSDANWNFAQTFSASEWVDTVKRWGGANVWTGLRDDRQIYA